jgi:putative tricarboxylic transport membrane protein
MVISAPLLSSVALKFQSAEYFTLTLLGISCISSLGSKHQIKAIIAALLGLLAGTVGIDPINGIMRYSFGQFYLSTGFDLIPIIIGCFALPEVYLTLERYSKQDKSIADSKVMMKLLSLKEMLRMKFTFIRSAIIGTLIGILPAAGGTIGSIVSYGIAVRSDKDPERFGQGAYEGIIASEASNNACVGGAMVPTMILGIPGSGTSAIIMAAFMIHGVQPGPLILRQQPILLYSVFISIFLASLLLFLLGRYIAREFSRILMLPYPFLASLIIMMGVVGAFALKGSYYDVAIMFVFSLVGLAFKKFHFSTSAFILAFVLGDICETSLRRQILLSHDNFLIFFQRPISCVLLIASIIIFISPYISNNIKKKQRKKGLFSM